MEKANRDVRRDARALWEEIFPEDSASFLNYYETWKIPENRISTRYEDGRLASMIQWNPYRIRMRGRTFPSFYLVAVATRPEYRHRGYMAGLLREGLARLWEQEVPFVFLMPAEEAIYRPFDFRFIYRKTVRKFTPPAAPQKTGLSIRPLEAEEEQTAARFLMNRLEEDLEVFCVRDVPYLRQIRAECRSEGGDLEAIFEKGRLAGLFSWWENEIRELVTRPELRTAELMTALGSRFAGREEMSVVTEPQEGGQNPAIMGRIVHLPSFLSAVSAREPTRVRLRVRDPILAENEGSFLWDLTPEGSVLRRGEEGEPDVEAGTAELISWLMGGADPQELPGLRTSGEGRRRIRGIEPLRGTFFNEIV